MMPREPGQSVEDEFDVVVIGGDHAGTEAAVILTIEGERLLPDGRYGATVTVSYPSVPMPKRFFFFFTQDGGRLLIDGILGEISFSVP